MAALAYLLLPVTGMLAFFSQRSARVRFHGAQAVALGVLWPILLYGCSVLSAVATQLAFAFGLSIWILLMGTAAAGRDVRLPLVGSLCARAAGLDA